MSLAAFSKLVNALPCQGQRNCSVPAGLPTVRNWAYRTSGGT